MNSTYAYLVMGATFLAISGVCLLLRRDLARPAILLGLVGCTLGPVSELLYLRDYWQPPTIAGVGVVSPEDVLFGFGITAACVALYPLFWRRRFQKVGDPRRLKLYCLLLLSAGISIVGSVLGTDVNSIIATILAPLAMALVMVWLRRDLLWPALCSAGILTLLAIVLYAVLFAWWNPGYWHTYWLLEGTSLGIMLPGNIPLTEVIWYAACGFVVSISYPFISGKRFVAAK